jgi:hypothetical protein
MHRARSQRNAEWIDKEFQLNSSDLARSASPTGPAKRAPYFAAEREITPRCNDDLC